MSIGRINKNSKRYIDLTHQLTNDLPTYPGADELPPHIESVSSIEDKGFALSNITMSLHVGTHIDAPAHMIVGGKKLSDYPIEHFIGSTILIDVHDDQIIDKDILAHHAIAPGSIALFYTGHDKYFYSDPERYFMQHPVLTQEAVQLLILQQIKMVGFDLPGPDRFPFELHKLFLKNDILIIENLTHLEELLSAPLIELYALPLYAAVDGGQARVVAKIV